ncbi:MAG TPA: cyclic nucleotide-binding domain-containing protein [Elusimicrobiota bacterium]|nr:cyclic nucleotide-binding domain-containing protein [Elusimicrobiota bacterium]
MDGLDRVKLLRALALFSTLPEARLKPLAEKLEALTVEDGRAFIVEGAKSGGLYYVLSGRVRVAKRLGEGGEKDLAFLGAGDCLGEMDVLREDGVRSASAYAAGRAELLHLKSSDLKTWLDADPADAARFFASLSEMQSGRLRRTSDEVALLYDLSQLLLTPQATAAGLLTHALERVTPHLQGAWSAEARAYNQFEDELDLVARRGTPISSDASEPAPRAPADMAWTDDRTLVLMLSAPKRRLAQLRFRADAALTDAQRAEAARTLGAVARLLTSALENIEFRTDEALRERLRKTSHGPSF